MGQERVGDLACGLAEYRLIWKVYGRGAKLVLRGAWVQRLGWGGESAGSRDGTGFGSGQCLSLISFELVRGLTAVVYCRHTGGKASSPHKWGKAGTLC